MEPMRRRIAARGFRARSFSYPSMRRTLAENADRLARFCRELDEPRLHLVGHSMGGLVVLCMLAREPGFAAGRVVLTGSPVAECHAGRRLARLPGGRVAIGRSLPEWLASARPSPDPRIEVGVIAGRLSLGLGRLVAPDLPEPNDGVVCVEETRLPAMRDHIVLHVSHSGMLVSRAVARQICAFLRSGAFEHHEA